MSQKSLKYIFYTVALLLLVTMVYSSRFAGISCDEVLHYGHSEAVFDFFASGGTDRSALHTPDSHLKYYGQSFDNIATILIHWLRIDDVYRFRHIMSALAGWSVILLTALFAVWLSGYGSGFMVLFLFAVSPTFIGHAMNNLKDVPFALGYVASVFFSLKFIFSKKRNTFAGAILLTISIAVALSIRATGLLLICYLFFFFITGLIYSILQKERLVGKEEWKTLVVLLFVTIAAFFMSILLWPYALQDPMRNVIGSYRIMAQFPSTFRQIFEGNVMWSDHMPWYYIPKSMAITVPLAVTAGLIIFLVFMRKIFKDRKAVLYGLIAFTIIFPLVFVMIQKSNLYSSWRQFLFLYPLIVLLAAEGYSTAFNIQKVSILRILLTVTVLILSFHPVRFMIVNFPYSYIYYNQLVGGVKGAHGNYETDYYYTARTEASEWLINHLSEKKIDSALAAATYSVAWQFRDLPGIRTSSVRNEERSMNDWDYAIITNRYITPFMLKNEKWPPDDAMHIVYADSVPLCAVLERKTRDDYRGYLALEEGRNDDAIRLFRNALKIVNDDEMIFYNFARALINDGQYAEADSVLKRALEINPESEVVLMYLGNIAKFQGKMDVAADYYKKLLGINRKYYDAYVELDKIMAEKDK
ncbi:MAG: tetratricopeptide repeat protein [Bacteroidota bacterium]